jgi:hypothetical protein
MSQAIRHQFLIFSGSPKGGLPSDSTAFKTAQGFECSEMWSVKGLIHKTVQISAAAADLLANPIIIEGTISENATDKANWFAVSPTITASGLYTLLIDGATIFYEPELSYIRISATQSDFPGVGFPIPRSLLAVFAGLWVSGRERWCERIKDEYSV